jgi:hypothetical protein
MALDALCAIGAEPGNAPAGDVGQRIEAPRRILPRAIGADHVQPDHADIRVLSHMPDGGDQAVIDERRVGVQDQHKRRRRHRDAMVDAGGKTAIANRARNAQFPGQAGERISARNVVGAVIDDNDLLKRTEAVLQNGADAAQRQCGRAIVHDEDFEIARPRHDAGLSMRTDRASSTR